MKDRAFLSRYADKSRRLELKPINRDRICPLDPETRGPIDMHPELQGTGCSAHTSVILLCVPLLVRPSLCSTVVALTWLILNPRNKGPPLSEGFPSGCYAHTSCQAGSAVHGLH